MWVLTLYTLYHASKEEMLDDIKGVSRTRKMKKDRQYDWKKGQNDK